VLTTDSLSSDILKLKNDHSIIILIQTKNKHAVADIRKFFFELVILNSEVPVIIKKEYFQKTKDEFQLSSSTDIGSLLLDKFSDAVWLCSDFSNNINTKLSFGILQTTRTRISKTEYISCPSCGRTLSKVEKK
jgi:Enzyme involved in the deoxyxylulose pathway of isoprenoid biosynthesis